MGPEHTHVASDKAAAEKAKAASKAQKQALAAGDAKTAKAEGENKALATDAEAKAKKVADMSVKHEIEMHSNAATWAGSGAPPPLTAGDTEAMASRKQGFDPSLLPNPLVEPEHTRIAEKA